MFAIPTLAGSFSVKKSAAAPAPEPDLPVQTDLLLWWDMSDSSTLWQDGAMTTPAAVGDYVGLVQDKSGQNNHGTQSIAAEQVQVFATSSNGTKTCVCFERGATDAWIPFTTELNTIRTIFFVLSVTETGRVQTLGHTTTYNFDADGGGLMFNSTYSSTRISTIHQYSGSRPGLGNFVSPMGNYNRSNAPWLKRFEVNPASPSWYLVSIQSTDNLQADRFAKDRADSGGGRGLAGGFLCELIVYSAALSADNVTAVENYLKTKWGDT